MGHFSSYTVGRGKKHKDKILDQERRANKDRYEQDKQTKAEHETRDRDRHRDKSSDSTSGKKLIHRIKSSSAAPDQFDFSGGSPSASSTLLSFTNNLQLPLSSCNSPVLLPDKSSFSRTQSSTLERHQFTKSNCGHRSFNEKDKTKGKTKRRSQATSDAASDSLIASREPSLTNLNQTLDQKYTHAQPDHCRITSRTTSLPLQSFYSPHCRGSSSIIKKSVFSNTKASSNSDVLRTTSIEQSALGQQFNLDQKILSYEDLESVSDRDCLGPLTMSRTVSEEKGLVGQNELLTRFNPQIGGNSSLGSKNKLKQTVSLGFETGHHDSNADSPAASGLSSFQKKIKSLGKIKTTLHWAGFGVGNRSCARVQDRLQATWRYKRPRL